MNSNRRLKWDEQFRGNHLFDPAFALLFHQLVPDLRCPGAQVDR